MTRKAFLASIVSVISAVPFFGKVAMAATDTPIADPIHSFDARDWAACFVDHVRKNPAIPLDEACMTTWFASALMRGHDERQYALSAKGEELAGAVARGWCSDRNRFKAMDVDLAEDILAEVCAEIGVPRRTWPQEKASA
jgi:hypothetical protein